MVTLTAMELKIVKQLLGILIILGLSGCSTSLQLTTPPPDYVETRLATISSATGHVRYIMRYEFTVDAPVDLFAKIVYQQLSNHDRFHTSNIGTLGNAKILNFNSLPENQILNKQYFSITLMLYKDAEFTVIAGQHTDILWFDMPETVAEILKITLL